MDLDRFQLLYDWGVDNAYLSRNPNLTPEQIDLLYQTKGVDKYYLSQFPKLTEEQFMRFFNDEDFDKDNLARNPNLTTEQIDLLYQSKYDIDRIYLGQYPKLTDEQFMRFFNASQVGNKD